MNKKLISILLPCRERHERTINLLKSIEDNTLVKDRVEVIAITDFDKIDDFVNIAEFYNEGDISYDLYNIVRPRDNNLNKNYYNFSNLLSEAYFCWSLGNDTEIVSLNWDEFLYEAVKDRLLDIDNDKAYFYVNINDDTHTDGKRNACYSDVRDGNCFPIISQNFCKKIRGPFPDYILNWGADGRLYNEIKLVNGFEWINLNQHIKVEHFCHHTRKIEQDDVNKHIEAVYKSQNGQLNISFRRSVQQLKEKVDLY